MWVFSLEFVAFGVYLHILFAQAFPVDASKPAATDITETGTRTETRNKLDIYFIDSPYKHPEHDVNRSYRTDISPNASEDERNSKSTDFSENKVHNFLLTATDSKQSDNRHELYTNPKIPEIQFKTESPFSLQTVASPFLVQNSVRAKQRLKRRASRHKRLAPQNLGPSGIKLLPQYEIKDPTWFKKYERLYSNARKASVFPVRNQINYNNNNQRAIAAQTWQQNPANPALRNQVPSGDYHYGYVYPLYQLHAHDSIMAPNYMLHNANIKNRAQIGQRRYLLQNNNLHLPVHNYYARQQVIEHVPSLVSKAQPKFQNFYPPHIAPAHQVYQPQSPSKIKSPYEPQSVPSDYTLQRIGLKDDASFIDATPNYDSSRWTLNAMQSIIPKVQGRNDIPRHEKPDVARNAQTRNQIGKVTTSQSLQKATLNSPAVSWQNAVINNNMAPAQKGAVQTAVNDKSIVNIMPGKKMASLLKDTGIKDKTSGLILQDGSNTGKASTSIKPAPKNLITTTANEPKMPNKSIASSSDNQLKNTDVNKNIQTESNKRDVIFKAVDSGADIDSDAVTAENLVTIFSELDSDTKKALTSEVAKKDEISQPQDDAIEMNVYKQPKKEDSSNIAKKVSFVNVPAEKENGINFEQKMGKSSESFASALPLVRNTIERRKFDLKRLHFGLSNGNTFE